MANKKVVRTASQRQLRVGEQVRQSLSEYFLNQDFMASELEGLSITVSEVRVSPDLKNSTAFVSALGGNEPENFLKLLNQVSAKIRHEVALRVNLRYTPRITFQQDETFEKFAKINDIFNNISKNDSSDKED